MAGNADMPRFTASNYTSHTFVPTGAASVSAIMGNASNISHTGGYPNTWVPDDSDIGDSPFARAGRLFQQKQKRHGGVQNMNAMVQTEGEDEDMAKGILRVVRVFLVDPDERVPMDKRILHRTDEITTDSTDQELFFSIPVQELLKKHNDLRASIKWRDEGAKGEPEPLKEIRIRDLIMQVTTVASFQGR